MSSGKTANYNLNQWQQSDLFLMEEFNADNAAIDAALGQCALVNLKTVSLEEEVGSVSIDLSDLSLSPYGELHFRINACHDSVGLKTLYMTLNNQNTAESYLYADMGRDESFLSGSTMPVGELTNSTAGCQSGLKVELSLYDHGISYHCTSMAQYSGTVNGYHNYGGTLGMQNFLTRDQLTSVQFLFDGSTARFLAGSTITVYGVRG